MLLLLPYVLPLSQCYRVVLVCCVVHGWCGAVWCVLVWWCVVVVGTGAALRHRFAGTRASSVPDRPHSAAALGLMRAMRSKVGTRPCVVLPSWLSVGCPGVWDVGVCECV